MGQGQLNDDIPIRDKKGRPKLKRLRAGTQRESGYQPTEEEPTNVKMPQSASPLVPSKAAQEEQERLSASEEMERAEQEARGQIERAKHEVGPVHRYITQEEFKENMEYIARELEVLRRDKIDVKDWQQVKNEVLFLKAKQQPSPAGFKNEPVLWLGAIGLVINAAWVSQFGSDLEPEVMGLILVAVQGVIMSAARLFVRPVAKDPDR